MRFAALLFIVAGLALIPGLSLKLNPLATSPVASSAAARNLARIQVGLAFASSAVILALIGLGRQWLLWVQERRRAATLASALRGGVLEPKLRIGCMKEA